MYGHGVLQWHAKTVKSTVQQQFSYTGDFMALVEVGLDGLENALLIDQQAIRDIACRLKQRQQINAMFYVTVFFKHIPLAWPCKSHRPNNILLAMGIRRYDSRPANRKETSSTAPDFEIISCVIVIDHNHIRNEFVKSMLRSWHAILLISWSDAARQCLQTREVIGDGDVYRRHEIHLKQIMNLLKYILGTQISISTIVCGA